MLDSNSAPEKIEPWGLLLGNDGFNQQGVSRGNEGDSSWDMPTLETVCVFYASLLNGLQNLLYDKCTHTTP